MCCVGAICSCLGSACMGCCCSSLSDCRVKHGPGSRIPYIFIMFVMCIFAVFMTLYGDEEIYSNDLLNVDIVWCDEDENEACQANGSVYRVSFCLFIFFLIHTIIVRSVASFHWLFWGIKFICLIVVLVLTYFVPNEPFEGYADFARVASIIFLLLQVVVLISWAYDVNDRVMAKYDEIVDKVSDDEAEAKEKAEKCCLQTGLITATLLIYVGIIVFVVLMYTWFEPSDTCSFNSTVIGITICLVIVMTVLPIMLSTGSIFTTGVVSFYVTYLCFAALENVPNKNCNTFAQDESVTTMWVGIIITTVAICYVGFSVSSKRGVLMDSRPEEINMELEAGTKKRGADEGDDAGTAADSNYDDKADLGSSNYDDADGEKKKSRAEPDVSEDALKADQKDNVMFHLCMAFASVYMAMLYTNWGTDAAYGSEGSETRSWTAVWINLAAQWTTIVLFIWTAVAPKVCPSRFGIETEDD